MSKTDWQGCSEHKLWREGCIDCWCPSKTTTTNQEAVVLNEYWKVILFSDTDIYMGSERFDAKWKAMKYIDEQNGRIHKMYAKLQHYERRSEEKIDIPNQ